MLRYPALRARTRTIAREDRGFHCDYSTHLLKPACVFGCDVGTCGLSLQGDVLFLHPLMVHIQHWRQQCRSRYWRHPPRYCHGVAAAAPPDHHQRQRQQQQAHAVVGTDRLIASDRARPPRLSRVRNLHHPARASPHRTGASEGTHLVRVAPAADCLLSNRGRLGWICTVLRRYNTRVGPDGSFPAAMDGGRKPEDEAEDDDVECVCLAPRRCGVHASIQQAGRYVAALEIRQR